MDDAKCRALKAELAARPESQVVPIDRFFDGNDDLGSIGCNLNPHPGIDVFRDILVGLFGRSGVDAVYAQVAEVDPGEECWPFVDTVLVVGRIPPDELEVAVTDLEPDEVGPADGSGVAAGLATRHGSPVSVIWWD